MKKLILILCAEFILSGCQTDLESLLGKENGSLQEASNFCSGQDRLSEGSRSLGNRGCGRPDKNLIQAIGSSESGEIWITLKKMSDGKFPEVKLSYGGILQDSLEWIDFTCRPANSETDENFLVQSLICKANNTDRRLSRFEMASSDRRLRLSSIQLKTDCGASISYRVEGPSTYYYCSVQPGNDSGVQVGQFIAPDLYQESEY